MAGLDPAIHVFFHRIIREVDAREDALRALRRL